MVSAQSLSVLPLSSFDYCTRALRTEGETKSRLLNCAFHSSLGRQPCDPRDNRGGSPLTVTRTPPSLPLSPRAKKEKGDSRDLGLSLSSIDRSDERTNDRQNKRYTDQPKVTNEIPTGFPLNMADNQTSDAGKASILHASKARTQASSQSQSARSPRC